MRDPIHSSATIVFEDGTSAHYARDHDEQRIEVEESQGKLRVIRYTWQQPNGGWRPTVIAEHDKTTVRSIAKTM